jgi:hypothetical protein
LSRWLRLGTALLILGSLAIPVDVRAASKIKIASIGDQAPGGGQFLGPALTGAPSAAGNGWVTFRSLVTDGSTSEQIISTKLTGQEQRHVVAALGRPAGKSGGKDLGTFKQFLGRPTVNANGDVAFVATLTNSEALPGGGEFVGLPAPAGVFLWQRPAEGDAGDLRVVALARDVIPGMGMLDFTITSNALEESSSFDLLERTPALTDAGDVAFLATAVPDFPAVETAAIFVGRVGSPPEPRVRIDDAFGDGKLTLLGAPAINASGVLAFKATVDDLTDGVFTLTGSTLTRLAADGDNFIPPEAPDNLQVIFGFGDLVSINDAGDVAFAAGGMIDAITLSSSELQFGTLVARQGIVHLVTYPGQLVDLFGRIRGGELGPDGGNAVAIPSIQPDGSVYVFGELTGGNGQAFFHADPPDYQLGVPLIVFGGGHPDPSPLGGFYFAAGSAPVADAAGNLAFFTRLAGAPVREALVLRPQSGNANSIVVGQGTPTKGRFGGPPFSSVVLNDADTVVFKSSVATGPSSLGLFRWRASDPADTRLSVLVRTGDPAPVADGGLILDIPGDPSVNANGDVAVALLVAGVGRGIFAVDAGGLRTVALPDQSVSFIAPDAQIESLATNPLMMTDGSVVFRATFAYEDLTLFTLVREEGLFRIDPAGGATVLVRTGQNSPSGLPFFRFRDTSTSGSLVVVRAPLGLADTPDDLNGLPTGFFLIDPSNAIRTVIMDHELVGGTIQLEGLTGRAVVDDQGNVAFLGRIGLDERTVLVRSAANGTSEVLAQVGGSGPTGGFYRSIGRPAMSNTTGHLMFRGGFDKFTGGTSGFFLAGATAPRPFIQVGEPDEDGTTGHLTSVNPSAALNANDHLAFVGSVSSGASRNGVFLAAPTRASVTKLAVRRRDKEINLVPTTFGSARGHVRLELGDLGKAIQLDKQSVTIVVSHASGTLFSATVPRGALARHGRAWTLTRKDSGLRRLQVVRAGKRAVRVTFRTGEWLYPFNALDQLKPPLSVRVDVGAHSGTAIASCSTPARPGRHLPVAGSASDVRVPALPGA